MDILGPVQRVLMETKDGELKRIAAATGVGHGTLVKLKYKHTTDPRVKTVQRLFAYLCERTR